MRLAIIGRGQLAIAAVRVAVERHIDVRKVVVSSPEPTWAPSLSAYVLREHLATGVASLDRSGDWRSLIGLDVDVILSVGYERIIGKELIDGPARVVNLHLGKLPEYRGMRPVNWALKNGDRHGLVNDEAGVTLHEVTPEVDAGPIIAQTVFDIWPKTDEVKDVYHRALHAAEGILRATLPKLDQLPAVEQDESWATYYSAARIPELGDRSDWTR